MFFKEIVGQEDIKHRLIRSVKEQRISHAQLLAGPEGSGKLALAIAYAQYISCRNPQENDSCGVCPECKKYQKLIHPDLHFVFPIVKSSKFKSSVSDNYLKEWREMVLSNPYFNLDQWLNTIGAENAQGMIYTEESDQIIRKLNLKTFEAEYKVMIIWMPEKMNPVTANKLLKMIEEPPAKTLFLLVSENESQILGTIRSRTQLLNIPPIAEDSLKKALETHPDIAAKDLNSIINLSNGNYLRALSLLNPDEQTLYYLEKFKEVMRLSYSRKVPDLFIWANEISAIGREKQKAFLLYCLKQIRENFIANARTPEISYMSSEESEFSARFSPFINEKNVISISQEFEKSYLHVSMNGNPKIIFLDMALKITKLIR